MDGESEGERESTSVVVMMPPASARDWSYCTLQLNRCQNSTVSHVHGEH